MIKTTNTKRSIATLSLAAILAVPVAATAHPNGSDGEPAEDIHVVVGKYENCFFDLHSELTQSEFHQFAKEAGHITRFRPLTNAETLGKWKFNISLSMSQAPVDDSKGAWNNTMSHPDAEHYLGHEVAFPRLVVRMGVTDNVDIGAWGTIDPNANYGFVGIDAKIAILRQSADMPVSLAIRPNVSALIGPKEVWVANGGVDVSVSRNYKGLSPYLGVGVMSSIAVEKSDDVDLNNGTSTDPVAFAGLAYKWKKLNLAAEAEAGPLTTYAVSVGGGF